MQAPPARAAEVADGRGGPRAAARATRLGDARGELGSARRASWSSSRPAAEALAEDEAGRCCVPAGAAGEAARAARTGQPARRRTSTRRRSRMWRSSRRSATDLETALRELAKLIRDTDRQIRETLRADLRRRRGATSTELVRRLSSPAARPPAARAPSSRPGAGARRPGRPRRERPERAEDEAADEEPEDGAGRARTCSASRSRSRPAGKAMKRLSLLSGGEKSMTALAFLFSVFLARPCPFYILDEVEAALDDLNIDRFLTSSPVTRSVPSSSS